MAPIQQTPAIVLELAASVPQLGPFPPRHIAWAERADAWVIVFEDGRKLVFPKTSLINPADGIDNHEARVHGAESATAGKALAQHKQQGKRKQVGMPSRPTSHPRRNP
jgi:hypothetical protein